MRWHSSAWLSAGFRNSLCRHSSRSEQGYAILPLPQTLAARAAAYRGKDVYLGLRPEIITGQNGDSRLEAYCGFIRAVDVIEPTGPDTMLVFSFGDTEAIVRVRPIAQVSEGTRFCFQVNMEKAKLFDPVTGRRI